MNDEIRTRRFVLMLAAILSLLTLALLWLTEIPLGVPKEWTWSRHRYDQAGASGSLILHMLTAAVAAAAYLAICWSGLTRIGRASWPVRTGWLLLLSAGAFVFLSAVQRCTPDAHASAKPNWVLYDPGVSGYFFETVFLDQTLSDFLFTYEDRIEGEVLHVGTHPPGLFLKHRGLVSLCRGSKVVTDVVLATQGADRVEAFSTLEATARIGPRLLTRPDRSALWLAVLLTQLAAALTVFPIFALTRMDLNSGDREPSTGCEAAWMATTLWPLVPAIAIFLPKSDALLPLLFTSMLASCTGALRTKRISLALLTGTLAWINMTISLAVLPVGLVCTLMVVRAFFSESKAVAYFVVFASMVFIVFTSHADVIGDINLPRVWLTNYRNHAGFYAQSPRTWWKWTLVNPVEAVFAAGAPLVVLATVALFGNVRRTLRSNYLWAMVLVWMVLWLSGKNMGEAGRLWLFLMPWLCCAAAYSFESGSSQNTRRLWIGALGLQMLICVGTVARVSGFAF